MKSFPGKIEDWDQTKFSRLTLLDLVFENGETYGIWECECDKKIIKKKPWFVINGYTKNCGCLIVDVQRERAISRNYKYGEGNTRLAGIWRGMKNRCYAKCGKNSEKYYQNKIEVCEEWRNDFLVFKKWALENGYQENLTIERKDNTKGYFPDNCIWIPLAEQPNNRSNTVYLKAFGEEKKLIDWLKDDRCKATRDAIKWRLKNGWDIEDALSTPCKQRW